MPPAAKGAGAHTHDGRGLAALVFVAGHHAAHALHQRATCLVALQLCHECARSCVFGGRQALAFNHQLEHFVQHRVGRQAVHIALAGGQFGRGFLVDDGLGNQLAPGVGVDVARQGKHLGLVQIANQAQAAVGVAIQRAVAHGDFALVARGEQQVAEGVGVFHQHRAANAGLQVLQRQACQRLTKAGLKLLCVARYQLGDRVREEPHAQVLAERYGIIDRAAAGVARGHGHAHHVVRAQGLCGQRQRECTVDAARAAHHHLCKTAAPGVVLEAQHDLLAVELHGGDTFGGHGSGRGTIGGAEVAVVKLQGAHILHKPGGLKHHARIGFGGE